MLDKTKPDWWKQAVIYQIYPKSFMDSNGDGVGDLEGIRQKLDYLADLGVDALWLCPVLESPQVDNGYDISDYRAIDPLFGSMDDMRRLIREAKLRGISIIMDMVLNHTSDKHRWFREALKGPKSPYYNYYIWRDGTPDTPPNDMKACFGGSAWTWAPQRGQYYFHQFAPQQPDLNWENPAVRAEIYTLLRWWVAQGVEGFRLDVIDQIAKEPDRGITQNGPRLHEYLRGLGAEVFKGANLVTVGEAWGADVERAKLYSAPDGSELSMVFQFEQMMLDQQAGKDKWDLAPLDFLAFKHSFEHWQQGLHGRGWNSLFLNNHDLPRVVSRWGSDGEYRARSAKALATMLHGMQGTPYVFQGEELGMTNIRLPLDEYRDLETLNYIASARERGIPEEDIRRSVWAKSRDNARTPMQWNAGRNAGFSTAEPWMPVNPNYTEINAEAEVSDPDSVFNYYKKLIALRKRHAVFAEGDFTLLAEDDEQIFAYRRCGKAEELLVVCNLSSVPAAFVLPRGWESAEQLISNVPETMTGALAPWEARILLRPAPVYKNYVFDLYGTLADIHTDEAKPALWQTLCRLLAMRGVFWHPDELRRTYQDKVRELEAKAAAALPEGAVPEIEIGEVFRAFYPADRQPSEAELAELARVFRALSLEKLCLFDGVPELLQKLRAAGKKVYLLSNAQALFTRPELTALGIENAFDGVLLSSEAGRKKPDPEFFKAFLTKYGLAARATLMIGNDAEADCEGADKMGMDSCYVETEQSPRRNDPLPASCRVLGGIGEVFEEK